MTPTIYCNFIFSIAVGALVSAWGHQSENNERLMLAAIKDNGCSTSKQSPAPGKTQADIYNYASLRGK